MAEKKLQIKLTQLDLSIKRTNNVLQTESEEAIERHLKTIKLITSEIDERKVEEEAAKIEKGNDIEAITEWNESINATTSIADEE